MKKKINILWIEEETEVKVADRRAVIASSNNYTYKIIEYYTEALEYIKKHSEYDVIIIDIRILFGKANNDNVLRRQDDRYGVDLIRLLYDSDNMGNIMSKVLVFTNESWDDLKNDVEAYISKDSYMQKGKCSDAETFEEFILSCPFLKNKK